jgi:hypothetical protein
MRTYSSLTQAGAAQCWDGGRLGTVNVKRRAKIASADLTTGHYEAILACDLPDLEVES